MAQAKAPSSANSAVQPVEGAHLPLSELNNASAKTGGSWVVDAYRPTEDNYLGVICLVVIFELKIPKLKIPKLKIPS